ncbi:hypothetical protein SKAU_G00306240 [Synaphobranchus kaupii]|uniref:Secreted protein n=1 Tax=Synaphobranchus kaupii TaxID=118154 RepID=A0A9Q1EQU4_SYNKA|nr:hypothetical protein SKAU_G00306240 [Synaphobranchus kaupii]
MIIRCVSAPVLAGVRWQLVRVCVCQLPVCEFCNGHDSGWYNLPRKSISYASENLGTEPLPEPPGLCCVSARHSGRAQTARGWADRRGGERECRLEHSAPQWSALNGQQDGQAPRCLIRPRSAPLPVPSPGNYCAGPVVSHICMWFRCLVHCAAVLSVTGTSIEIPPRNGAAPRASRRAERAK